MSLKNIVSAHNESNTKCFVKSSTQILKVINYTKYRFINILCGQSSSICLILKNLGSYPITHTELFSYIILRKVFIHTGILKKIHLVDYYRTPYDQRYPVSNP